MRIALLCGTQRGVRVLKKLKELAPSDEILVFSFGEKPWEPLFLATLMQEHGVRSRYMLPLMDFDLLLAVNWRFIIPPEIYNRARLGAFVFHDSLLPAYRGFSPTVWAMINGEEFTGATLFKMSENVDEGNIVSQRMVQIGPQETVAEVMEKVTEAYLNILETNLPDMLSGVVSSLPQVGEASYCCRRLPSDNRINWNDSSQNIFNLVRAVTAPYPGAWTTVNGRKLTIWAATFPSTSPFYAGRLAGRVVSIWNDGVIVMTGDGLLFLTRVQFEGEPEANAADVLKSLSLTLGT